MQFPTDTFRRAGLGATDVAKLFTVTRVTGHKWLTGGNLHRWVEDAVAKRARDVEAAVASGALPLQGGPLRGEARAARIKEILDAARG